MKNKLFLLVLVILVIVTGSWAFANAVGEQITVCVKKDMSLYILDTSESCKKGENLLSWNIIGSKGDTGERGPVGPQGEPGLSVQQGAGNILFMYEVNPVTFLKTDGTVWQSGRNIDGTYFVQLDAMNGGQIPVPVNDIVLWRLYSLIDKDGNFWRLESPGSSHATWLNYGPLP